jgi:hypothetical protein
VADATTTYAFLSAAWLAAVDALSDEFAALAPTRVVLTMNLTVTDLPGTTGDLLITLDTTSGALRVRAGHATHADVTIRVDGPTARALLLGGDQSVAMAAFMDGKVTVEGDMSKLMDLQLAPADDGSREVVRRLRSITA